MLQKQVTFATLATMGLVKQPSMPVHNHSMKGVTYRVSMLKLKCFEVKLLCISIDIVFLRGHYLAQAYFVSMVSVVQTVRHNLLYLPLPFVT